MPASSNREAPAGRHTEYSVRQRVMTGAAALGLTVALSGCGQSVAARDTPPLTMSAPSGVCHELPAVEAGQMDQDGLFFTVPKSVGCIVPVFNHAGGRRVGDLAPQDNFYVVCQAGPNTLRISNGEDEGVVWADEPVLETVNGAVQLSRC